MNHLHRFRTKRTYRSLYKSRRKEVPNCDASIHDTAEHDNLDEGSENVVNVSQIDLNGGELARADDHQSTWSESTRSDDQGRPESLQLMPTGGINSPHLEPTTPASDHDSHESLNASPPGAEPPAGQHQAWLPFYLRKYMFVAFAILLGIMVVALEVLFAISRRNQGLTESRSNLHYLWTYGPTAILTLAQAYWSRVDYEARVAAPWLRANPICASRDALLLDYVDMFPLVVPFRALKRRDYPVAASATISLLFTILVVLSTGLFTLSPVEIADGAVPISLKTRFVDDPDRLKDPSSLSLYSLASVFANYTYPDGVSDRFAYQSFTSALPGISETRATVDGIYLTLNCEQAALRDIYLAPMLWNVYTTDNPFFEETYYELLSLENSSASLEYEGCHSTILFDAGLFFTDLMITYNNSDDKTQGHPSKIGPEYLLALSPIDGFSPGKCGSASLDDRRLVFVAAEFNVKFNNVTAPNSSTILEAEATILHSTSLACTPDYGITSVDVVRNATGVKNVSRHDDTPPRKFPDINSWDILHAYLDDFIGLVETDDSQYAFQDNKSESIFWNTWHDLDIPTPSLVNTDYAEPLLVDLYQNFAAITLKQSLTDSIDISSTATATRIVYRLLVQPTSCQLMVATMVLMMIILIALSSIQQKLLPRLMEPGSILATAALAGQLTASRFPHNLGAADTKVLETRLASLSEDAPMSRIPTVNSNNRLPDNTATNPQEPDTLAEPTETFKPISPFVLSPAFRITLYILIASCVVALEVMLQRSIRHQGLWDVQDETYLHYAWTVLPAAIVSLLALSITAISSQTRLLAPYHSLIHIAPITSSLDMDLLRPLLPQALFQQIRTRSLDALATSVAALISSAFTIGVAALYQLEILSVSSPIQLRTTSTLATACDGLAGKYECPLTDDDREISLLNRGSSLILENNVSYTSLSYENLVFPGFVPEQSAPNALQFTENTVINAVIPAARHRLSCRWYADSDINASFFYNQTVPYSYGSQPTLSDGIAFNITGEDCTVSKYPILQNTGAFMMDLPADGFFATAIDPRENDAFGCSSFLYIWGRFSSLAEPPEISMSALGCNATTETVDVNVSFLGSQLLLDPSRPPQPIESTLQSYDLYSLTGFYLYDSLHSLPLRRNDITFDTFFEQLVTSRYAIPISSIGDPSQAQAVKDAILFQHGVIAAQYLSVSERWKDLPNGSNTSVLPMFPSISGLTPTTDTGVYSAIASDPYGRRRLVQDPASTRVVEALLLAALVLSLLGWILGPRKAVLPRSPTSVASVLALLAGGDVLEYMYKCDGGDWETVEDAKAVFPKGCKFWMGWGRAGASEGEEQQRFGIWMVPNPGETLNP